jgi:hypothetical protein
MGTRNNIKSAALERQVAPLKQGNELHIGQIIAPSDKGKTAEKVTEIFQGKEKRQLPFLCLIRNLPLLQLGKSCL